MARWFILGSKRIVDLTGGPYGLAAAIALALLGWFLLGMETTVLLVSLVTWWQLFPLQASQNRDTAAIQTKLDTIIGALDKADDAVQGIEKEC